MIIVGVTANIYQAAFEDCYLHYLTESHGTCIMYAVSLFISILPMKEWRSERFSSFTKVMQLLSNKAKTGIQVCLMAKANSQPPSLSQGIMCS